MHSYLRTINVLIRILFLAEFCLLKPILLLSFLPKQSIYFIGILMTHLLELYLLNINKYIDIKNNYEPKNTI